MERMFEFCMNLEYLDIHNFNTLSVTNMDYMFHSCSNLKNLDLSKFNTSSVKSMMAMFAGCLSLDILNLTYFDFSNTVNTSYMFFDSGVMILDLSNFKGDSIIFIDDILKFNPNLKYIGLKNYNGKDIFNNLDADSEIIICADDDTMKFESNLLSLKEKNIKKNCSDYCFSEFSKIKEDKRSCEIDCSKIENEANIYYYLCKKYIESSIISDTINIESSTILDDPTINKQTIWTEIKNIGDSIISDTTTMKQTILPDITNVEKTIPSDTTNMEQTKLHDNINFENNISRYKY
jgi:surface protein